MRTEEKKRHKQKPNSKIVNLLTTLSITTFDVKGLNNPIKRQRLSGRFKKTRSNYMLSTSDIVYIQRYKSIEYKRKEEDILCQ